ncbi:hypothetical protein AB0D10_38120 [Kitasatospora sp. NPDC048545]|uniref:hypothetical protein n=1 Tax=Kitasatospora sp. NPDC048545 TaxID=3157208 RepID=UPI0033E865CE
MRASDLDPTGELHAGLPTYPWRWAPSPDLMTRRQLRAVGLSGVRAGSSVVPEVRIGACQQVRGAGLP